MKNGRWRGNVFVVAPRHEANSLIENNNAVKIALLSLIFISVLTVFQIWREEIEIIINNFKKRLSKKYLTPSST